MNLYCNRIRRNYVRQRSIREMLVVTLLFLAAVGFVVGCVAMYGFIQRLDAADEARFAVAAQMTPQVDAETLELFGWTDDQLAGR